jgi:hypothetical protein
MTPKKACVLLAAARIRVRLMLFPTPPKLALGLDPRGDGAPKSADLWLSLPDAAGASRRANRGGSNTGPRFSPVRTLERVDRSFSLLQAGPPIGSGRSSDAAREQAVCQPARRRRTSPRFMNAS